MVYQIQLVRGTEINVGFTTSEKPKNLIIYKYVGTPCTFQQIALKEIENYI